MACKQLGPYPTRVGYVNCERSPARGDGTRKTWRFKISQLDDWMKSKLHSPHRPLFPERGGFQREKDDRRRRCGLGRVVLKLFCSEPDKHTGTRLACAANDEPSCTSILPRGCSFDLFLSGRSGERPRRTTSCPTLSVDRRSAAGLYSPLLIFGLFGCR